MSRKTLFLYLAAVGVGLVALATIRGHIAYDCPEGTSNFLPFRDAKAGCYDHSPELSFSPIPSPWFVVWGPWLALIASIVGIGFVPVLRLAGLRLSQSARTRVAGAALATTVTTAIAVAVIGMS